MPDLRGLSVVDAKEKLSKVSWKGVLDDSKRVDVTDNSRVGKIQSQSPPPGELVKFNAPVTVTVGRFQPPIP